MDIPTILIVEDNKELREGLQEMLAQANFTVLTAGHGREALQQMSTFSVDLILSDIRMPEMDGIAFFKEVRSRAGWETIPFIFLTSLSEKEDVLAGKRLGAEEYLIKPIYRDMLVTSVRSRLERAEQIKKAHSQQAIEDSLTVLANAIDMPTRNHVQRVTEYSLALAGQLGWQERRLEVLRFGARLHDIGKIHIDTRIRMKNGPLTPEEWIEIKKHPDYGADMIKEISYLAEAAEVIRHHHERWDGKGYPYGLTAEEIPAGARIVTVADSFDTMTMSRPYSPARTLEQAYQEVFACARSQFDPNVVTAFHRAWEAGQIHAIAEKWKEERLHP